MHSEGGYGSIGYMKLYSIIHLFFILIRYQYDWKIDEAKKNVLRTHTTAISARYLYDLSTKALIDTY